MKLFKMTIARRRGMLVASLFTLLLLAGCMKDDIYKGGEEEGKVPAPEEFPDFSTRSTVNLSVDYEAPGRKTLVEVYTESPYSVLPDGTVQNKEILPIFAAYTDNNSKLTAQLDLPTMVKHVYLCNPFMGMPQCVEIDVENGAIQFKTSDLYKGTAGTKAAGTINDFLFLDNFTKLYSLSDWNTYGKPTDPGYLSDGPNNSALIASLQKKLWGGAVKSSDLDNLKLTVEEKYTNITIANTFMKDNVETTVKNAKISVFFLTESAFNQNVFGYYFYPKDKKPLNASAVKKYVVFPNVSMPGHYPFTGNGNNATGMMNAPLKQSQKVNLLYVDDAGKVSQSFPPGYTIGWFLISDGFKVSNGGSKILADPSAFKYSNESWNNGTKRCIALNAQGNTKVVVGFEDGSDKSCEDMLFYVESDPAGAIVDPEKPTIDGSGDILIPDKEEQQYGTYAFEDQWPEKRDYDMNDVVIEYKRVVTFDKDNKVKKIVDTFKPVEDLNSAKYINAFAYQVDASQLGTYTLSDGIIFEAETNSFIVSPDVKASKGKVFTITRTFASAPFLKTALKPYNPFIIAQYKAGDKKRTEVHLPKRKATIFADPSLALTKDDAYYMDKTGKYPFAIDLVSVTNFIRPEEGRSIDDVKEYPDFAKWVAGGCGTANADWYTKHATIK